MYPVHPNYTQPLLNHRLSQSNAVFGRSWLAPPKEQVLADIVAMVDVVLDKSYGPRQIWGSRMDACRIASELVVAAARMKGMKAKMFFLPDIYDEIMGYKARIAEPHFFVVAQFPRDKQRYLLDLSVNQYLHPSTPQAENKVLRMLNLKGYLPLDEGNVNLRGYLLQASDLSQSDGHYVLLDTLLSSFNDKTLFQFGRPETDDTRRIRIGRPFGAFPVKIQEPANLRSTLIHAQRVLATKRRVCIPG